MNWEQFYYKPDLDEVYGPSDIENLDYAYIDGKIVNLSYDSDEDDPLFCVYMNFVYVS